MPLFLNYSNRYDKYQTIENHYSPLLDKAFRAYDDAKETSEETQKYNEYFSILSEYEKVRDNLYQDFLYQELEYFTQHIDELCKNIANYITSNIELIKVAKKVKDKWFAKVYKNDEEIQYRLLQELKPHLDLLKQKAPQKYEDITKKIDDDIKSISKSVVNVKTSRTKKIKTDTTKIGSMIMKRPDNDKFYDEQDIQVLTGKMKSTNIIVSVSLEIEELKKQGLDVPSADRLTPFDGAVLSTCMSLYEAGNQYINSEMIYSTLSGNKKETKLTENMRKEIIDSMKKLMVTRIRIDAKNEFDKGRNSSAHFYGVLLPNSIIENEIVTLNGKEVKDCIKILDESPLYKYAKGKRQIRAFNTEMLDALVNNTREAIELKFFLAQRITDMQNPKDKKGYIIRYDTIFEYIQIGNEKDNTTLVKKKRIRQLVRAILDDWKKRDIIKDYEELNEDGKKPKSREPIAKIKITLNKVINSEEMLQ